MVELNRGHGTWHFQTHLGDISPEVPAQLQQVLVGMFALLLPTSQLRRHRVELPLQTQAQKGEGDALKRACQES